MKEEDDLNKLIKELLTSQRLGVLSTHYQGHPYASLVAFASSENLYEIYFSTPKTTRKFRNLTLENRVSMLVDNRSNRICDFHDAMAVTILGTAKEIQGNEKKEAMDLYLYKHPYLLDFITSESCAMVTVLIDRYILVRRFQEVFELHIKK